ncbi:hypothetical protein BVG19_g2749 [[Candida] boidinii]|nr:hypothetical protein BVG19_g2749 [[Candida] boidinii]
MSMSPVVSTIVKRGKKTLSLVFRENRAYYRNLLIEISKLNLNYKSKPVFLFLLTIFSSSTIFVLYNLTKFINRYKLLKRKRSSSITESLGNDVFASKRSANGNRELFVPYKDTHLKVAIKAPNYDKYEHDKFIFKKFLKDEYRLIHAKDLNENNENFSIFHSKFLKKLFIIWKLILIPKFFHKNTTLLISQIFCLIFRTWLSLLVTKLDGQIVKDLIGLKGKKFIRDLIYWFLLAFPASYTNAGIKFLTTRLALNFRSNLIRYCHDLYMDPRLVYYKLQFNNAGENSSSVTAGKNASSDSKDFLDEYKLEYKYVDQYLTEDIKKFSDSITSLFSNVGKPFMDLLFFAFYLRDNLGTFGIIGIFANYFLTGWFLKMKSPNFNKLWKRKTSLEGIFYNYNLNLINNCEEISFYQGIVLEKEKIQFIFKNLLDHITLEINERFYYGFWEDYILKYTWSGLGYLFASIPIIFSDMKKSTISIDRSNKSTVERPNSSTSNMKQFIVNKRLMLSMADAGSRLMYSIKDISRLSGCTDRLFTLLLNLHQVHDIGFQYGLSTHNSGIANQVGFGSGTKLSSFTSRRNLLTMANNVNANALIRKSNNISGTIQTDYNGLRFERIPIVVPSPKGPNGQVLVDNLTFKLDRFDTLLILGDNGSGKTSIMRILAELWPLYSGLLSKPSESDILYVSQKPYFLSSGTLRDQIIYPLSHREMVQKGYSDDDLITCMQEVGLGYLLQRFKNMDFNPNTSVVPRRNNKDSSPSSSGDKIIEEIENNENGSENENENNDEANQEISSNEDLIVNGRTGETKKLPSAKASSNMGTGNAWFSLLSGGERQKLVMARIIFHNKQFVILDEPTNAVSYDMEDELFEMLIRKKFTFVTISHRPLLAKYHDFILELHHDKKWEFRKLNKGLHNKSANSSIDPANRNNARFLRELDKEIKQVEAELAKANEMKVKREKIRFLLDTDSDYKDDEPAAPDSNKINNKINKKVTINIPNPVEQR